LLRLATRTAKNVVDALLCALAFVLAFGLRFDWRVPAAMWERCLVTLPYVVVVQVAALHVVGVPRFAWRYVGLHEAVRIGQAIGAATALVTAVRAYAAIDPQSLVATRAFLPLGVIVIDAGLAFAMVSGVRFLHRVRSERRAQERKRAHQGERKRTLLVGAGGTGVAVARQIEARPDLGIEVVGFVDDDAAKLGSVLSGFVVLGSTRDLARLAAEHSATQALLCFAGGKSIRAAVEACKSASLEVKVIPGLHEIVGGQVELSLRDVAIEDLLRREPVKLETDLLAAMLEGRSVMVTGAGGSIGSELCRQVARFGPSRLVLVERSENALFHAHRELVREFAKLEIVPCIADVCDEPRMSALFVDHGPAIVFHAAAHKHVPMMEWNPAEAVKNNVFGTRLVAELAARHKAERFVLISTDKAVNPTSVMGASKRAAEIAIQALAPASATRFMAVRFGNVLGSAGSVVPLFREQIARGGPVTVTHPDMRRYFMTIPEACQLVMQAGAMGRGGELFILDMGEPVRIVDLAEDLIRLSGLRPGDDIEVRFSGMRPGEKLFEELSVADENADKTRHPKIFVGKLRPPARVEADAALAVLRASLREPTLVRDALREVVPEYTPDTPGAPKAAKASPATPWHSAAPPEPA
jgi:FlaA1/EpsC-like NDP-sugar epimerase